MSLTWFLCLHPFLNKGMKAYIFWFCFLRFYILLYISVCTCICLAFVIYSVLCIHIFRCASISSIYPCPCVVLSVRPLVTLSVFQFVSVSGRPTWKVEKSNPQLFLDAQASLVILSSYHPHHFYLIIVKSTSNQHQNHQHIIFILNIL